MENTTPEPKQYSEAEASEWVRSQFQAANKYLAEQGILPERVLTKDSRYLVPYLAVWKFETKDRKNLWLINGDVPTDIVGEKAAPSARDAMKHFALQWQLKAEAIMRDEKMAQDPEQMRYARYLIERAEGIYAATEDKQLWQNEG
ncbi:DUF4826 family protein [Pseudidiomarina taiwanensis]|uniref:DUF4826 domain-containing protein n=1 Tax=Pseudidiomarina taiwanensis TaxID=337250 RepID=A0A432ZNC8_9GAMM|nr:DUF4826 family protein [Pseudidiomarina taiwanensis]RUO79387.1 DUF4826 domain-containing protein [Pseudidiomarina taiwanensis]